MKLLDRHLASQYFEVLGLATLLIGGIFLGTTEYQKVLNWICNFGVDWEKACLVSFLQLPSICVFALPAGTLIATIFILYRLNNDGELLALRVAGVSQTRLMAPFFALGLAAAVLSFSLSEFVSPVARRTASRLLLIAAIYGKLPTTTSSTSILEPLREDNGKVKDARLIWIGQSLGRALKNVVLFDISDNQVDRIHWAESGEWHRGQWHLLKGHTYALKGADQSSLNSSSFNLMVIDSIAAKVHAGENCSPIPEHKTTVQLHNLIDDFRAKHQPVPADILIEFYQRYSQPLACLLLVVAAFPIAVGTHQRGHSAGMVYGGVMITTYFLIQQITGELGYNGRLEPILAAWLPSICLMLLGLICLAVRRLWRGN